LRGTTSIGAEAIGEGAVVARWRMGDGAILTIALNLGLEAVELSELKEASIFAEGKSGQPGSVAVWLER
jgi:maltooligosyltrehalose trehalohydrolase